MKIIASIFQIGKSYFYDLSAIVKKRPKKRLSLMIKRTFDLVGSSLGIVFFWPVIFLAGLLIKYNSKGPMMYSQKRVGENGKIFVIHKLRTMTKDAESKTGPIWAKKGDERIIKGAHLLRRFHIDELPQLFNILKGQMSFVGPRPERPEIIKRFDYNIPNYNKKFNIKPGITGYAQIRHKYDETIGDVKMKLRYELFYINRMCLLLDLKIMFATVGAIIAGRDEYKSMIRRLNSA